jgi:hypothetical protein
MLVCPCRYEKLWSSSIDQAVCEALQAGWKLPRLLEPPLMFLANQKVSYMLLLWHISTYAG